jgi:nucleotide-binding universal stress UspA family protein
MYKHILVPVDGSAASNRGVLEAIKLAKGTGANLRLVHVVEELVGVVGATSAVYPVEVIESLRGAGRIILDKAVKLVRDHAIEPQHELLEAFATPAAKMIVAQAREWPADLVVLGSHGRRGLRRLAMGSDAEMVLRASQVPVLIVRAEPEGD